MKAADFQEPYLRFVLGFIGITDVEVVRVEGVALGEEAVTRALRSAQERVNAVVPWIAAGAAQGARAAA
jgi:FMN-dependent NADH-azoreductase